MSYISFPEISPEIISVEIASVTFAIRWYAVAYIVGIVIGWRLALSTLVRPRLWGGHPPMSVEQSDRLLTWIVLGVILGGRLGFVFFYQPDYYLANPWKIPMIWQGGMSFHGGFVGVVLGAFLFCRKEGIPPLSAADVIALGAPPGIMLGRIANFINAELWGRPTSVPWGVAFPGDAAQSCALEAAAQICVRHPSQIYEAILEGLLLGSVLLWLVWRRGWLAHSGRIAGMFFVGYATARFLVEFFRQPDLQFISEGNPLGLAVHLSGYGVTMGQLLSVPMLIAGFYFLKRRTGSHEKTFKPSTID